jgi:enoyl-CoA hydratase/carnithine racemase
MSDLIISDDGPIRTLRMNRPAKKNALTLAMYDNVTNCIRPSPN